jgi:diaminopimelate epimerase
MQTPIPFHKYHALGNDYIVIAPDAYGGELTADVIELICQRNFGIGSDGILYGPLDDPVCDFGLRIFNPDGSEAEKSGNGLRIFSRYLWDQGLIGDRPATIATAGGAVEARIEQDGRARYRWRVLSARLLTKLSRSRDSPLNIVPPPSATRIALFCVRKCPPMRPANGGH